MVSGRGPRRKEEKGGKMNGKEKGSSQWGGSYRDVKKLSEDSSSINPHASTPSSSSSSSASRSQPVISPSTRKYMAKMRGRVDEGSGGTTASKPLQKFRSKTRGKSRR